MTNKSIWHKNIRTKRGKELKEDIETNILIIGAGITGLTAAYFLKDKDVTIIDKGKIGYGKTAFSTGKVTYLQDLLLKGNKENEDCYLLSQIEASNIIKKIILSNNIKCNYESNFSYLFAENESDVKKIKKIEKILSRNDIKFKVKEDFQGSHYSIKVEDTFVINPVKYLLGLKEKLSKEVRIYENSIATDFDYKENKFITKVNDNYIKSNYLIVTTGYPFLVSLGLIPFRAYIEKGYIGVMDNDKNKKYNAISANGNKSIRFYLDDTGKEYMLYSNFSDKLYKCMNNEEMTEELKWKAKAVYNKKISSIYSNTDVYTFDKIPLSGELYNNLYIATGYSGWGLTNGSISAKIISDSINGYQNQYKKTFNPNRKTGIFKGLLHNMESLTVYISSKLKKEKKENAYVYEENNIKYGKYIDSKNEEHIVYNKCPHMGCNLAFNNISKTWDCPCHSSRFDIDGNIIFGPSHYSIKVEKKKE